MTYDSFKIWIRLRISEVYYSDLDQVLVTFSLFILFMIYLTSLLMPHIARRRKIG